MSLRRLVLTYQRFLRKRLETVEVQVFGMIISWVARLFKNHYRLELNKNCLVCERTINPLSYNNATVTSISHPIFPPYHVFQATSAHPLHIPINHSTSNVSRPSISWTWRGSFQSKEELNEQNNLINLLVNLHLSNDCDVWEFTYDASRRFSVNSMRKLFSTMSSDTNSHPTRWNKLLPSKVTILTWHVLNKILPTRFNLDRCGIDLDTVRCPLCNNDIETEDHIFVKRPLAIDTWKWASLFLSRVTRNYGHRISIVCGGISFLVGDVLNIAAAVNFAMLLSGRIMLGVCISCGNLL
ncbi:RNA-directed DNA polymerase, eukaryota, reverse transcriptase zinc-binding domain protein [Tanacetum coccineum]